MRTPWSAGTVKLLGAGLDEANFVEDVSRLVGDQDVPADSWSHGQGRTTRTSSTRRERILPAAVAGEVQTATAGISRRGATAGVP